MLEKAGNLAAMLTNLEPHDVLFIDESTDCRQWGKSALSGNEDYQLDIMIGEGPAARSHQNRSAAIYPNPARPLAPDRSRRRCAIVLVLCSVWNLSGARSQHIVGRSARLYGAGYERRGALEVARAGVHRVSPTVCCVG
ncbi:hypothetical protein ACNKHO_11680 [Shigella flexneri]